MSSENNYIFTTDDDYYRTVKRKRLMALRYFWSKGGIILFAPTLASIIEGLIIEDFINELIHTMPFGWISILLLWVVNFIFFTVLYIILKNLCGLEAYGLSRKNEVWVINFADKTVCEAQLITVITVDNGTSDFDQITFKCKIKADDKSETVLLYGRDIYFSENTAKKVLCFIEDVNDNILNEYHPNWKKDTDFAKFIEGYYIPRMKELGYCYGFLSVGGSRRSSWVVFTSITLNGYKYKPAYPLETLFELYIKEKNAKIAFEKRKQQIRNQLEQLNRSNAND